MTIPSGLSSGPIYLDYNAVDAARQAVAELIDAASDEIVFTGGGSDSDALAIRGATLANPGSFGSGLGRGPGRG
ncbi:MAG: aminotransferase class V-fold PLP-dependent enzyme [Stackebrandtia sp.]